VSKGPNAGKVAHILTALPFESMQNELLRTLPSIERMLLTRSALELADGLGRDRVRDLLREVIDELRVEIAANSTADPQAKNAAGIQPSSEDMASEVEGRLAARAAKLTAPSLRRVVNATGVIIHTNLGRSPLAKQAIEAMLSIASGYSNLEYDLDSGARGRRESHCQALIARLAGSEDAIVANNNAAAVMLVLNSLAEGGEVIVSRGELIEIGGSFRIPDVMEKSGARLREVGTTNRTRIADYQSAINDKTRLILRVHTSNYRIIGFTERPSLGEIAELSLKVGIPSFEDLGSGCLVDLSRYGVTGEPLVADSLRAGISIVSFSGDKMLGGPQAGVIAGTRALIDQVRKNPLMRALRVDKLTYSALEATLRLHERGAAESEIPVIRAISMTAADIGERALDFAREVEQLGRFRTTLQSGASVIGGGSAPGVELPTVLIELEDADGSASELETMLRESTIPIITRAERDRVLIDLRTVMPDEELIVLRALRAIVENARRTART
jgi:L-seryl-tRNA(Ser) seleniumtransferase